MNSPRQVPAIKLRTGRPSPLAAPELDELVEANRYWGNPEAALDNARSLGDSSTHCVLVGQQPGLLLGPLFTVYKALGAVRLAAELTAKTGAPVVPVFWIAAEDHDFAEVSDLAYFNSSGALCSRLLQPEQPPDGRSIFAVPAAKAMVDYLWELQSEIRQTEFTADLFERLQAAATASLNLETFFARLMAGLFGSRGLILASPRMKFIRQRGAEIVRQELAHAGESSRLIIEAGGADGLLHRRPEDVNVFHYDADWRRGKIVMDGGNFLVGAGQKPMEREALLEQLALEPEKFSYNVATRPVVQDAVFPTAACLAGPAEVQYLAQLKGVYRFFGVEQPAIVRRPSAVLIEPRVLRALQKLGLTAQEFLSMSSEVAQERMAERADGGTLAVVSTAASEVEGILTRLKDRLPLTDPAVAKGLEQLSSSSTVGFAKLRERLGRNFTQSDQQRLSRLQAIEEAVRPFGKRQERVLNIWFPFLNQLGPGLLEKLDEELHWGEEPAIIEL